jgi:subtilisin family serine protease
VVLLLAGALATSGIAMAFTPNDADWNVTWPQANVKMPLAWNLSRGSRHVVVAVVDSGINPNIKDFAGALVPGWDFVSGGYTQVDEDGHGTLMASVIAARGNNNSGIPGYCWGCKIMPVRVVTGTVFDTAVAAAGIRWAVDHGANIIVTGFSEDDNSPDPKIAAAIAYAARNGVLVLASAGNSGSTGLTYPADDPGAYPVAGTNKFDRISWWSTRGNWIHLAAPGCQLALNQFGQGIAPCGSSVAAPAVAGIAGLMLSVNPSLTPAQIISILESTAKPIAGIAGGRVNAYAALRAAVAQAALSAGGQPVRLNRLLGGRWNLGLALQGKRIVATLRSPKARSCSLSLAAPNAVWLTSRRGRRADSLVAQVSSGKYRLAVSCKQNRLQAASLTLRAFSH